MSDSENEQPGQMPSFFMSMPPDVARRLKAAQESAVVTSEARDRALRAIDTELRTEYELAAAHAHEFDWVLAEPLEQRRATIEQAAAGVIRHAHAADMAAKLAKSGNVSHRQKAEYRAWRREHQAAESRWYALLVDATGVETRLEQIAQQAQADTSSAPGD